MLNAVNQRDECYRQKVGHYCMHRRLYWQIRMRRDDSIAVFQINHAIPRGEVVALVIAFSYRRNDILVSLSKVVGRCFLPIP